MIRRQTAFALSLIAALGLTSAALAQESGDLAKAAQNPVAAMINLPFQNNTLFGVGPDDDTANVLNIQPVIPFRIGNQPVNVQVQGLLQRRAPAVRPRVDHAVPAPVPVPEVV